MTGQCEHNDNGNNGNSGNSGGGGGVLGGLGRLGESVGVLAAVDPRRLGDEELLDAAVGLAAVQRRLDAAEAHLLGELEARDVPDRVHGHRTSGWLAAATGLPAAHTKSRVRTANALRQHFGLFAEALGEGRVGWAYCRALQNASNDRILPGLVELQEYLLSRVPGRRFERWAAELRALCAELDEDGPEPDAGERDSLVISETGGVTVISGCVHGSEGEELSQAIEVETERLYRRAQADAKACPDLVVPGWMTLRAKALLELIRRAQHTCTTNGRQAGADITLIVHAEQTQPTDTDDTEPTQQASSAGPGAGPASTNGQGGTAGSGPASKEQTDESAVPPGGHDNAWMGPVFRPDGTPLAHTPGTVDANLWRLCCTANIRSFVVDGDDLPIRATLNQRLASPLQRRMVLVRDGGCVPGMRRTPGVDPNPPRHPSSSGRPNRAHQPCRPVCAPSRGHPPHRLAHDRQHRAHRAAQRTLHLDHPHRTHHRLTTPPSLATTRTTTRPPRRRTTGRQATRPAHTHPNPPGPTPQPTPRLPRHRVVAVRGFRSCGCSPLRPVSNP
ncbi:MAG: DUF222 domain-containing protein [Microthrixaceae bacterium]